MFGHKFARFVAFNNSFFYFGILNFAIAVFCAESIVKIFVNTSDITTVMHFGYVMLIAIVLLFIFLFFNYLSLKWSKRFQILTTGLKFIPLIGVGLAGIIYGIMNPGLSLFNPGQASTNNASGVLSIDGMLASLPAILFAYDSFLGVASLQGEMENPKRKVPLTIIIGMSICIAVYLFITIGQIMVASGTANGVFNKIFADNETLKTTFSVIISFFIFVSAIGCLNSLVLVGLRTLTFTVQYRIFFGTWLLDKYSNDGVKSGLFLSFILYTFWWVVFLIPSAILNTDALIDGASNFPTLFMFAIYGSVVLKAWFNRFNKKVHVSKMPGFIVVAPLSALGCYLAFGYQFFYYFSIKVFVNPEPVNWGLFASGSDHVRISAISAMIVFFTMVAIFILFPFINDSMMKIRYRKIKAHELLKSELLV